MRSPLSSIVAATAVAAIALTACGGKASNALTGRSPGDIIATSAKTSQQGSLRFDAKASVGFDASHLTGVSSSQAAQFAPLLRGVSLTGTGEQESAQRVRMTMSLKPLLTQQVTAVAYDGSAYVSLDGSRFSAVPSLRGLSGGFGATPNDLTQYLQGLTSVRDLGSTQQDGQTVEHLQATLDQSVLQKALSQAGAQASGTGAGQPGQLGQLFTQFFQLQGGTVDAYVLPSNGQLDRVDVSMKVAIDFDRLKQVVGGLAGGSATNAGAQIPGGSLGMTVDVGVHYHDYGAAITVHKPTVDPNAPSIPSNGILGG